MLSFPPGQLGEVGGRAEGSFALAVARHMQAAPVLHPVILALIMLVTMRF